MKKILLNNFINSKKVHSKFNIEYAEYSLQCSNTFRKNLQMVFICLMFSKGSCFKVKVNVKIMTVFQSHHWKPKNPSRSFKVTPRSPLLHSKQNLDKTLDTKWFPEKSDIFSVRPLWYCKIRVWNGDIWSRKSRKIILRSSHKASRARFTKQKYSRQMFDVSFFLFDVIRICY